MKNHYIRIRPIDRSFPSINGKIIQDKSYSIGTYLTQTHIAEEDKKTAFIFEFSSYESAIYFLNCAQAISLFRNSLTNQPVFNNEYFLKASKEFPEMFFADYCLYPIRTDNSMLINLGLLFDPVL
jgi:hypothetical protein